MIAWRNFGPAMLAAVAVLAGYCGPSRARAQDSLQPETITLSETGGVPISRYLYGVNYDWNHVPQGAYEGFAAAMQRVAHYTLVRYPGGWNGENYNWADNTETGKKVPALPGVTADVLLSAAPLTSFITPSAKAIAHPENIPQVVKITEQLVAQYGNRVPIWEIGNEWWLQSGARIDPAKLQRNLQDYAALLAAVVPAIKAENPSIKVFATVDWTRPDDIAMLRQLTGAAWSQIDGISVHTYCGNLDPDRLCSLLPAKMAIVRAASGKQVLYSSEWAVVILLSQADYGIKNASYTIDAFQDMALAGITYATYWPPVNVLPSLSFVNKTYDTAFATGIAFGWMSQYYEGTALHTGGPLPAVAARNGASTTVIIPSEENQPRTVRIDLTGTGMSKVISAEVMYSLQPDDRKGSKFVSVVTLPTRLGTRADGSRYVQFEMNPGTPGRGQAFEIARVTLE